MSTSAGMARDDLNSLLDLVERHGMWRRSCINLCAAETAVSPAVRRILAGDLVERYADYTGRDLRARKYFGTQYIANIEEQTARLARDLFGAEEVELRPLSGHIAGAAVIIALTAPGDTVLEIGPDLGGHRLATKLSNSGFARLNVEFLPSNPHQYNIDLTASWKLLQELRPKLVIVGSSNFLFEHPVSELGSMLRSIRSDAALAYDASHVLGLIVGKRFQQPLQEGADVVFASTHKTFPGPPGGVIYSNRLDVIEKASKCLYPGLITNHHPARLPALGIAMLEMEAWGVALASQTVTNAQALGAALASDGIDVVAKQYNYTRSHTLLVRSEKSSEDLAKQLEQAGIIVNTTRLPNGTSGIRIGVQECTRLGMREGEMIRISSCIAAVMRGAPPAEVRRQTIELATDHQKIVFGLPEQ